MRKIRPITETDMLVVDDVTGFAQGMQNGDRGSKSIWASSPADALARKVRARAAAALQNNALVNDPYLRPSTWVASTAYQQGQVATGLDGANMYVCKVAGTSAASGGPTGTSYNTVTDGSVTWEWIGSTRGLGYKVAAASAWAAATAYTVGNLVTSGDGYNVYICDVAGTSAAAPAIGPVGFQYGAIVADGTVVWRWYGILASKPLLSAITKANVLAAIPNYKTITPSITAPVGLMTGGLVETNASATGGATYPMVRGANIGTLVAPTIQGGLGGSITFYTDSNKVGMNGPNAVYVADNLIAEINDRRVDMGNLPPSALVNPGGWLLDMTAFGSNKVKKVTLRSITGFAGICSNAFYIEPSASIWAADTTEQLAITFEGDSLTQGGNNVPYRPGDDVATYVATMLGFARHANLAVGGTGFISDNGGAKTTYIQRLPRLLLTNPDIVVIGGNHNDNSYTDDERFKAVLTYLQALRDGAPDALVIVLGTNPLQSESTSYSAASNSMYQTEASLKRAFDAWGDENSVFIPNCLDTSEGPWITGTGSAAAPANNGNKDRFYGSGDAHPFQRGYNYFADRIVASLRKVFTV